MKYVQFTETEKAAHFDELAKCFYDANFGTFSKSEFELLMFRFYLEKLMSASRNNDGTIDYHKCSDYKISTDLGITQQRVRNLKVKSHLTKPSEFQWQKSLAPLLKNARLDKTTGKIEIPIPDPVLLLEIENYLEEAGKYAEPCLKSKLLCIRPEFYLDLQTEVLDEQDRETLVKQLRKELAAANKENAALDERHIGETIWKNGISLTSFLVKVCSLAAPGSKIVPVLNPLLELMKELVIN